ncbi:hypothetical protein [Spirosoma fluviale]|uniref:Uncharacterized protein n=1 Tax=Spirosoma fluviale TaxID=1597977 RepID=A0A286FGB1_9BACT|nr:hypothetical protein [Spirosoma fluviale]SOD82260.1 hypothetical protein SAMN06269250_2077 [Spirosoma fluviale]
MLLLFTTQDQNASQRNFSWWFATIETALDALSSVASRGNQLIKAEIIDEDHRISLPVDAFDGSFFSPVINELESEWQFLLSEPVRRQ